MAARLRKGTERDELAEHYGVPPRNPRRAGVEAGGTAMETLTWKSLVLGALRNRQVQEARAFAEDRREDHILEMGRLEAQMDLVNHYDAAADLLHALDRLRSRVAYELQTSGEDGAGPPAWSKEAVGIAPNGHLPPRPVEYPDRGRPSVRRRR